MIIAGVIIALATHHAADHVSAFVNALGAVGQVGIAIAVFTINRLQWRLQAHTIGQDRRARERQEAKQAENLREGVRESIDAFYQAYRPDDRVDAFDSLLDPPLYLKREIAQAQRSRIIEFVKPAKRVRDNSVAGGKDVNAHLIGEWRERADGLPEKVGASRLDRKPSALERRR